MKVRFTEEAELDLFEIAAYTEAYFGVDQRDVYLDRLEAEADALPRYLKIARHVPGLPGVFSWQCQSHFLYFREQDGELHVVRVLHERQVPTRHIQPVND